MSIHHSPENLARTFHEVYERLAPSHGYETRKASAVPWEDVPEPNKSLMVAVAAELLPLMERQMRAAIADQIEAVIPFARRDQPPAEAKAEAYALAARIARGEA